MSAPEPRRAESGAPATATVVVAVAEETPALRELLRDERDACGPTVVVDGAHVEAVVARAREQLAELQRLRAALERQAVVERAKGILMARHRIGEDRAFELLRHHARRSNRRIVEVAGSVLDTHLLFADPLDRPPRK